mmetsp:Transcript_7654/g.8839  ORF Transcript_7654/g.8839 Transcript_7654/m.8839 type:complete len:295 (-) Transcript_7654:35-919(-)
MLTQKIEIVGQNPGFRGGCCGGTKTDIKMDRNYPNDLLQGRMTTFEWTTFCEKIDKALIRVNNVELKIWERIACIAKFLLVVGVMVSIATYFTSGESPTVPIIGLVAVPAIYLIGRYVIVYLAWKTAAENISRECKTESRKRSSVNFHLREERHYASWKERSVTYYIECIAHDQPVTDEGSPGMMEHGMAGPVLTAVVATPVIEVNPIDVTGKNNPSKSAKIERTKSDRLQDLNRMVAMLTEEEYNRALDKIENDLSNFAILIPVDQMEELERQRATLSEGEYAIRRKNILNNM